VSWRDVLRAVAWIVLVAFVFVAIAAWMYNLVTTMGAQ
jgi:hypothetical protein